MEFSPTRQTSPATHLVSIHSSVCSRPLRAAALAGLILVPLTWMPARAQEPRTRISVPLPQLTVTFRPDHRLDEVFITYGHAMEGFAIADINDRYVKITPRERTDFIHAEMSPYARLISEFEAEQLSKVCDQFARSLGVLEKELQQERWGRLLYLDAALARFLRGFYYLVTAARFNPDALPAFTCLPDSLWNVEADSLISDRRVRMWREDPENAVKLRIAARELTYHIRVWMKTELDNPKRDPWDESRSSTFAEAYGLFVKRYFGLR